MTTRRPAARTWLAATDTVRVLRGLPPTGHAARPTVHVDPTDGSVSFRTHRRPGQRPAAVARFGWRRRRVLAPWPPALLYAAARGGAALTGHDPRGAVLAWSLLAAAAATAWFGVLGSLRRDGDRTGRTVALVAAGLAAYSGWAAAPASPPGLILALAAACSGASWARFRVRDDPPPAPVDDSLTWQEELWDEKIAVQGGPLPGSVAHFVRDVYPPAPDDVDLGVGGPDVSRETPDPIGFELAVELVPAKQEWKMIRARLGLIAGPYGMEEEGCTVVSAGSAVRALLTLTARRFLDEVKEWKRTTLNLETGTFVWQIMADGSPGLAQVWKPGQGVRHFWICGATNGGKSGAVDCLLANLMSAGIAVLDVTDLKGGASIPHWKARARTFGSSYEAAVATVRRADLLSAYRYDLMARLPAVDPDTGEPEVIDGEVQYGRTFVDPSPAWPIYVALIEEEPQIAGHPTLGPIFLAYAARIAALGRQACVILVFTSQGVTLDDVFGTNRAFRTNVQAGNVLVLWTDQGSANLALANRTLDLSVIPHGQAGVSLLAGPAQPREMPGRIPHVRRHFDAVRAARPGHLNAAEEAILDLADLLSAGADLADVRGLALGLAGDLADLDPDWAGAIGRILGEDAAAPPTADGPPPGEGYTMPARTYGDAALPPSASGLPAQQQAILDVLDAYGVASTADLRKHLGKVTDQALRNHLDPLLEKEIVERAGRGRYRRATPTDPTDPTDPTESSAPEPIGATP